MLPGCPNALKTETTPHACMHTAFPMGLPEFDPVRLTIETIAGGEGLEVNSSKYDRAYPDPT